MTDQLTDPNAVADSDGSRRQVGRAHTATSRPTRVSRWDRPPEPRDWRFFVGHLGRILIALGLLLFGFVAYQLWGTGIETARAQAELESDFEAMLSADDLPADQPTTGEIPKPAGPPPEQLDPAITGVVPAVEQNLTPVVSGQALMRLEIPKIDVDSMVVPGVSRDDLKDGPGHFPDTPLPGQLGNAAIAGHRTTYGAPFNELDELKPGDAVSVTRTNGDQYQFRVTETVIVDPGDYWVVTTEDPGSARLTLTTCHPETTASQRMAVFAELIAEDSAPVGEATFYEGRGDGSVADASERAPQTDDASVDSEAAPDTARAPGETSDVVAETGESAGSNSTAGATTAAGAAFTEGWFDDADAWPQIALWAAALVAIWIVGYLLGRSTRRTWVGLVVASAPFVVSLYFFYQNVNRLLPAGI